MKSLFLAASVALLGATTVLAQASQSKANPPNHAEPGPEYYIYQDIDYISTPASNTSACLTVQSIRSKCYSLGVKSKNLTAEQDCLCSPDSAYAVTQCFAKNYQTLSSRSDKANYYQDFLDYTYDCYCGITGYDVTYNRTVTPPRAYITGFTGDAILPPTGGCPAKVPPKIKPQPSPPCGCAPPPHPPSPPCPDGFHRVNKCCVPDPPPCQECKSPKVLDYLGTCNCPWYLEPVGDTCIYPRCPDWPNEQFVTGCWGGYCQCSPGYERGDNGRCVEICGWGEISDGNGGCTACPDPLIPDYDGQCICPTFYGYTESNGECFLGCPENEVYTYGSLGCYCPDGFYYDNDGNCVEALCDAWTPQCYPDYPGISSSSSYTYVNVTSSAPAFSSYAATTTYNVSLYTATDTVAPPTMAPPTLIPTTVPSIETTLPANSTASTTGPTADVTSTTSATGGRSSSSAATSTSSSNSVSTSSDTEPTSSPDAGSSSGGASDSGDTPLVTPSLDPGSGSGSGSGSGGGGSGGDSNSGSTATSGAARFRARNAGRQVGRWL